MIDRRGNGSSGYPENGAYFVGTADGSGADRVGSSPLPHETVARRAAMPIVSARKVSTTDTVPASIAGPLERHCPVSQGNGSTPLSTIRQ